MSAVVEVPETAKDFLETYLPAQFALAGVGSVSSSGAVLFRLGEFGDEWSMRLRDGALLVVPGRAEDVLLQVTVPSEDFVPLVVRAARVTAGGGKLESQLMAIRVLGIAAERAKALSTVRGTVCFHVKDGEATRRIAVSAARHEPDLDEPECRLECQMSDYLEIQRGTQLPMQLVMSGRLRIVGDAGIAMMMNAAFV